MDYEDISELIATNLDSLLSERKLKATVLAKQANLNHTAVRDILTRQSKNPSYITLLKIADAANVDVRRITIGPDYEDYDDQVSRLIDAYLRLKPEGREFLLRAAEAQAVEQDPNTR